MCHTEADSGHRRARGAPNTLYSRLYVLACHVRSCAVYCRGIAAAKEEPINFWSAKCLLFGGLALGELSEAVPNPRDLKPKNGRGAGR